MSKSSSYCGTHAFGADGIAMITSGKSWWVEILVVVDLPRNWKSRIYGTIGQTFLPLFKEPGLFQVYFTMPRSLPWRPSDGMLPAGTTHQNKKNKKRAP